MDMQKTDIINIKFLENSYAIPYDVIVFLNARDLVSNGLIKLVNEALNLMKKYNRIGAMRAFEKMVDDTRHIQNIMTSIVKEIYGDLVKRKIYDVNEQELCERITSIKQVETVATKICEKIYAEALEIQSANQASRNYAYNSAASKITGSGVSIFTNSFTSLMMYSAIENNILKTQAQKADQEYEQALRKISVSSENKFTKLFADALYNQFLPALPDIFTEFNDELLQNYLFELSQHGQFDPDRIKKYSENKSCTMIENLKYADDKKGLIIQAFELCPFNFDIYAKLIELGYFNTETMKDAAKIFPKKELSCLIEDKINNNLDTIEIVKDYIEVLAYYQNTDEMSILKKFYEGTINKIKNGFHEIYLLCVDSSRLSNWISDNISVDLDYVASLSESEIIQIITVRIRNMVDEKQYEKLSAMGLIGAEDIKYRGSTKNTLEEIQAEYVNRIKILVCNYVKELAKKKAIYEDAYKKYNEGEKARRNAIAEKNKELKKLGLLAFSKKKEIRTELDRLEKEYKEYQKTEPVDLKNAYLNM